MKKLSLVLAAAGLMALGACNQNKTPEQNQVLETGANDAAVLENAADNLSAVAENTTDAQVSSDLNNAASNADATADNVQDAAQNMAANVGNAH